MAKPSAAPRRQNRANWIGLRTLRQVPKVVDRTVAGDPVYEVRSVRLILPRDAGHFTRLVACAKCGREVPGPAVLSPADLDHSGHSVICKDCVRAATAPMFDSQRRPSVVPEASAPAPSESTGDDDRLQTLERHARALAEELAAHRNEWQAALDRQAAAREARDQSVDRAIERLDRPPPVDAGRMDALERRLEEVLAGLEASASAQRQELAAALDAVSSTRDDDRLEQHARALAEELAAHRNEWQAALDRQAEAREERDRSVDRALERLDRSPPVEVGRVDALERRLDELVARLEASASAQRQELGAVVDAAVARVQAAVQEDAHRTNTAIANLARRSDQRDLVLDASHQQLERVQATLEEVTLRSSSVSATVASSLDELARIQLQVNDRLDRQAERAARAATSGDELVKAVEASLREELDRLASTVDEHAVELRNALAEALEEMRSVTSTIANGSLERLAGLEQLVERRTAELAELAEVQATLDGGLGELRSQIAAVGEVASRLAARQQELDGRVAHQADPHPASPARRGLGRRSAETSAQMAAVSAVTDDMVRERQQLNSRLDELEVAADQATAASARASARASELAPLRADVSALREELLEHHEALESLRKSVDRLRRKSAAPPAEAKPAKRAATPAAAKPAKRATKR